MTALRRLCLLGLLLNPLEAAAEARQAAPGTSPAAGARLRVFLDCDCFEAYLRDQMAWVDFVRQPQDADVHVLSSDRETGGGGRELILRFVGRGRFADIATELRVVSQVAASENDRRAQCHPRDGLSPDDAQNRRK